MTFNEANFLLEVRSRIKDQDINNPHLSNADIGVAARAALQRYDNDLPLESMVEFAGEADKYYDIAAKLTGWQEGYSQILWIEYPASVVADDDMPTRLDPKLDYLITPVIDTTRKLQLYFPNHQPLTTENIRVAYTVQAELEDLDRFGAGVAAATTVRQAHETAFYHLGASFALAMMAAFLAQKGEPTIQADITDHEGATGRLRTSANWYREQYYHAVGLDKQGWGGAGTEVVDWDISSDSGRDLLFHGRRSR